MPKQLKLKEEFEILGHLGRGGMAEVYKARQVSLDRIVAIKELKPSFLASEEMVERFEREARSASRLVHENIVQVYQLGRNERTMFIVMEYVDGVDLKTIINRVELIPLEIILLIIRGAARALAFAHPRGLIHRDIKPGNIMIGKQGDVKLMDFGIVREIDSDLTQTGAFLGTPPYMSPEQFRGERLSSSSDLFSLGVVFYEALTGQKPFKADDDTSLAKKVQSMREVPPRRINPEVPWRTQRIVRQLLSKRPEKRPGSAQELAYRLEDLLALRGRRPGSEILAEFLEASNALIDTEEVTVRVESRPAEIKIKKETQKTAGTAKSKVAKPAPVKRGDKKDSGDVELFSPFKWLWRGVLILIIILGAVFTLTLLEYKGKTDFIDKARTYYEQIFKGEDSKAP